MTTSLPYAPDAYCKTGKCPCNECSGCLGLHEELHPPLDSLTDEQVALLMEAVQIGIQHGLDIAEMRIRGDFLRKPLSWEVVRSSLRRDD